MVLVVFLFLFFAAYSYFISGFIGSNQESYSATITLFVVGIICTCAAVYGMDAMYSGSEYYLPCEIVAVNETSTYFGTVDQDIQQIYAMETGDHIWPDDVPYLLYMDGKNTHAVTDDEILAVWRTD